MCELLIEVEKAGQSNDIPSAIEPTCEIKIAGKWLGDLGFKVGDKVVMRATHGRIELVAEWVDRNGLIKEREALQNSDD